MAVYVSRYLNRRQTTVTGKVQSSERYDRYYDIARDTLAQGLWPRVLLPAGRLLVRAAGGRFDSEAARTVPPGSSLNVQNRFNGVRLDGQPGQGALYVGTVARVLREYTHYATAPAAASALHPAGATQPLWQPGTADRTQRFMQGQVAGLPPPGGQRFHVYKLTQNLSVADLRLQTLMPIFLRLRSSGQAQQRYGIAAESPLDFQVAAASAVDDYSASRGMADAVADSARATGLAGVCAYSSRADRDNGLVLDSQGDPTGGLIFALFGPDGQALQALAPTGPPAGHPSFAALLAALG